MAKKRIVYRIDEERVPSVTTITGILDKPALIYWGINCAIEYLEDNWNKEMNKTKFKELLREAKKAHRTVLTEAGNYGSSIHELIDAHIAGMNVKVGGDTKTLLDNFKLITKDWKWLAGEIVVLGEGYGGTADALADIDGKMTLVDFKTGKGVYPEHEIQLALYAKAVPERKSLREAWSNIEDAKIVHLNKERLTWEVLDRDLSVHDEYLPAFMKLYEWNRINN